MKSADQLKKILRGSLKPTPKVSVSRWSDTYRMLPSDSPEPGRWRSSRVPYMREVMDAFTDGKVSRVVVKAASQISKTECLLNVVGRYAQLAPAPIMIIQPTLSDAQDFSKVRLSKMIADTKSLTPLFYERLKTRDANQTILSKFYKGGRIILVGANSPSGLASRPIKILLCDEVDRYPPTASKEGDPITIATARTSNYFDAKIGIFSTPTIKGASRIDVEYELGTQEEWSYRCPNCGEWHVLDYRDMQVASDIKKDEAGNRKVIVHEVKWRCPDCALEFGEQQMRRAAQAYQIKNPDALANGVRSFYVNGFSSPWLGWKGIMRQWLEAQGDPTREAVIMNTRFGLSYEQAGEVEDDKKFVDGMEDYGAELPAGVLLLTAGVDVQKNRLEYSVVGWGAGFEAWTICHDKILGDPQERNVWNHLTVALSRQFTFADGTGLKVARAFIDSGFATSYVYEHCRANMRAGHFAIKGKSIYGAALLHKTGYLKDAGLYLTILNVDAGKDEVYARLNGGKIHFGGDVDGLRRNFDEAYFKQLTAERRVNKVVSGVRREVWELVSQSRRNEALDVFVYALAAARSCVGSANEEDFWTAQHANLFEPIKKPAQVRRVVSRTLEY